jgi:mannose/cellobiose epimerase-like protein (N-acyl-D-glucosamine 2-epimerase family)
MNIITMKQDVKNQLERCILPFWESLIDNENGGFYGLVDFNGKIDKQACKGAILNSRILWFFSSVYGLNKDETTLNFAQQAYRMLTEKFIDGRFGGLYWAVDYTGKVCDDRKHTYNHAFAIYALAQYHISTGDSEALKLAMSLFELVEEKCFAGNGYLEEFDRKWQKKSNEMLSEHNMDAQRTMNTQLHLIEAYTTLYKSSGDTRVKDRIVSLTDTVRSKIYDADGHFLRVFFDENWNSLLDIQSYGHDIEASWLIDRAAETIGDSRFTAAVSKMTLDIADSIYKKAYSARQGVNNESVNGGVDKSKVWWVQAESVIGFYNAYQKSGDNRYLDASLSQWEYIKSNFINKKTGEWFSELDQYGRPKELPLVSAWKCPYHNGRMCIEMMNRLGNNV